MRRLQELETEFTKCDDVVAFEEQKKWQQKF